MKYSLPLLFFLLLGGFLWKGLSLNPKELPSVLIGHPSPSFNLTTVEKPKQVVDQSIFKGKITVLNVWATWCASCKAEHPVWLEVARQYHNFPNLLFVGVNYHDDLEVAQQWLTLAGNPYHLTLFDKKGRLGMDYGVYGTPETFILDKEGIIRYCHVGPINQEIWNNKLLSIIRNLND